MALMAKTAAPGLPGWAVAYHSLRWTHPKPQSLEKFPQVLLLTSDSS